MTTTSSCLEAGAQKMKMPKIIRLMGRLSKEEPNLKLKSKFRTGLIRIQTME